MNDAMQDSEKVEIEDEAQKTSLLVEVEPDTAALAAVEMEEKDQLTLPPIDSNISPEK